MVQLSHSGPVHLVWSIAGEKKTCDNHQYRARSGDLEQEAGARLYKQAADCRPVSPVSVLSLLKVSCLESIAIAAWFQSPWLLRTGRLWNRENGTCLPGGQNLKARNFQVSNKGAIAILSRHGTFQRDDTYVFAHPLSTVSNVHPALVIGCDNWGKRECLANDDDRLFGPILPVRRVVLGFRHYKSHFAGLCDVQLSVTVPLPIFLSHHVFKVVKMTVLWSNSGVFPH